MMIFSTSLFYNFITVYTNTEIKVFTTDAEFNGHSSGIYGTRILASFRTEDISVIYVHMVDFCRPDHNYLLYRVIS